MTLDLNRRNTGANSSNDPSPGKKIKRPERLNSKDLLDGNSGVSLITNDDQFVPDYELFRWTSAELRTKITIIIELPSGKRPNTIYSGVVDEGNTFEIIVDKSTELVQPKITFKKWLDADSSDVKFDDNHPKYIAYKQLLDSRKHSPMDVFRKKARFELPFTVESTSDVNIVKFKDNEDSKLQTVLLFVDLMVAEEAFKHVKPDLKMEEV